MENAKISIPHYLENKIFSSIDRELFILTDDKHVYNGVFKRVEIFAFEILRECVAKTHKYLLNQSFNKFSPL